MSDHAAAENRRFYACWRLENISGGEIRIGGKQVNNLPPKERDIAMVFQNYALYPHMTVAKNMAFSLMLNSAPQAEIDKRVNYAAVFWGLTICLIAIHGSSPVDSVNGWPWARHCARSPGLPFR